MNNTNSLLTTRAVAQRLGISESTVRNLDRAGKLNARRDITGRRLFDSREIEKFAVKTAEDKH